MGRASRLKKQRRQQAVEGILVEDQVLDLYSKLAPQLIYKKFSKDCCLNATRIVIEVLATYGIEAVPVTTRTIVMNAEMWKRVQAKGDFPDAPEMDEWVQAGAWALGADGNPRGTDTGWPWHLVAATRNYLIDSSSAQMSRPERGINIPGVTLIKLDNRRMFVNGAKPLVAETPDGAVVSYQAVPTETSYKDIPGFQRSTWNIDTARSITNLIALASRSA